MSGDLVQRLRDADTERYSALEDLCKEAADEIERLDFAFTSLCEAVRRAEAHWAPIETAPVPTAADIMAGNVVVAGVIRSIYTWSARFLIQTDKGYVAEGNCRYVKKCATAKVEQMELRWYVGRELRRDVKYWMPLPAPKAET